MNQLYHRYWGGLPPRLRLMSLYFWVAGFVFWYTTEKIFLTNTLHLSVTQLVLLVNLGYLTHFLVDVPTSIVADRWSRNRMLALSLCSGWLAALIGGLSHNFEMYAISVIFWAAASGLHTGIADALIYDICTEDEAGKKYAAIVNRFENIFTLSLTAGAVIGGVVATYSGLRAPYFASLVFMLPVAWLIWKMPEPRFHRTTQLSTSWRHIGKAFKNLNSSRCVVVIAVLLILTGGVIGPALYEFSALLLQYAGLGFTGIGIVRAVTTILAVIMLTKAAVVYQNEAGRLLWMWYGMGAAALALIPLARGWLAIATLFTVGIVFVHMTMRWLTVGLQQSIPSAERASTSSLTGTLGSLIWLAASPLIAWQLAAQGALGPSQVAFGLSLVAALISFGALILCREGFTGLFKDSVPMVRK